MITTLRGFIRKCENYDYILNDIMQMIEDDCEETKICKSLGKLYNIRIERNDVFMLCEISDAIRKKDYGYIEDKKIEWGKHTKYAFSMARNYWRENERLIDIID